MLTDEEMTSLANCVTRMKENKKDIYYITGESKEQVQNSVIVERLVKCGFELLSRGRKRVDEYYVPENEGEKKNVVNIEKPSTTKM